MIIYEPADHSKQSLSSGPLQPVRPQLNGIMSYAREVAIHIAVK